MIYIILVFKISMKLLLRLNPHRFILLKYINKQVKLFYKNEF